MSPRWHAAADAYEPQLGLTVVLFAVVAPLLLVFL